MAEPFNKYLNSVAKLDRYMRNLLEINKDLSAANHKLRSQLGTFEAREAARERIMNGLNSELQEVRNQSTDKGTAEVVTKIPE